MKTLILRYGLLTLGILFSIFGYYYNYESFSFLVGLFGGLFILIGLLIATQSSMLGFGKDLQTINGIGTTLYGKSNIDKDNHSYEATKWIVFIGLPIIPLGSYKVITNDAESKFFGTQTNHEIIKVTLNIKQIIKTYLISYGFIIAGIIFLIYM